jgi:methylmalonyl-CoA mutase N-terminal domain/subunit
MRPRKTESGIEIQPVYQAKDVADLNLAEQSKPGEFPFERGIFESMYRGRLWTMRQYAGYATARESNERYRYLLSHGQTGLSVAFDLPTQMGYDSDAPLATGEVGRTGVAIDTVDDMEVLFDSIPLENVSVSMTINAPAAILLAMYLAIARRRGIPFAKLSGTSQNDILKEYAARGTYIYPPAPSMRLVTDLMRYCAEHVPGWNTISVSGYHIREAGATAAQELAFALSNGRAYLRAAVDAGLKADAIAPRMSFFWNAHNNFFEEIAKFRAARLLWAHIVRDEFKAISPKSWLMRFHTQTGGSTLTAQEPHNNVVRVSRSTQTPKTRLSLYQRKKQRSSPCARNRSLRTKAACLIPPIRSAARILSNGSPRSSRTPPERSWPTSNSAVDRLRPSRAGGCSSKSQKAPTRRSARLNPASPSWSASISSPIPTNVRSNRSCSESIPRASASKTLGLLLRGLAGMLRPLPPGSARYGQRRNQLLLLWVSSSKLPTPEQRSVKYATRCATCSRPTTLQRLSDASR